MNTALDMMTFHRESHPVEHFHSNLGLGALFRCSVAYSKMIPLVCSYC